MNLKWKKKHSSSFNSQIKIKDDKKEQAMSMMTEEIIPSYEGTEGLLSMGAVMCDDTTGLNMSIWTDKASSDATESNLQSNIEKGAEFLDGSPEIYRGDLALGAIYEDRPAGSGEGDYARVVFAKVESEEAVTNFLKEKICMTILLKLEILNRFFLIHFLKMSLFLIHLLY